MRSKSPWFVLATFFLTIFIGLGNLRAESFGKHMHKANDFMSKGNIEGAITEFQEALRLKPGSTEAQHDLGSAYEELGNRLMNKGEPERAIEIYKGALETKFNTVQDRHFLDMAYEKLGDRLLKSRQTGQAIEAYKQALQFDPKSSSAQSWLGIAYERLGEHMLGTGDADSAIEDYKNALVSVPEDPYWHEQLGIALEKKGEQEAAIKEYHTAAVLSPLDSGLLSRYQEITGAPQAPVEADFRQARTGGQVETVGGGVSAPVPIYKPEPVYSERASQARIQGTLTLWAVSIMRATSSTLLSPSVWDWVWKLRL